VRLDRYVSQGTGTPRSEVMRWIRGGHVRVNGLAVKDPGAQVVIGRDEVEHRDGVVRPPGHLTVMLHKAAGYITSTEDGIGPTVMDLLPPALRRRDLAPVGRLDKDTTGLLLLTTDGGLNHALTHPRRHVDKIYRATLEGTLCADAAERFAVGVTLGDGTLCKPAVLQQVDAHTVRITLREGKFHQVKRMVAACGAAVVALHREQIGGLALDPALPEGAARPLGIDDLLLLGVEQAGHG
jgi:16S rRNA pseudouridine516 synthase